MKRIAIVCALAVMAGACGGEQVTIIDKDRSVRVVEMSPDDKDALREGKLDLTKHALVGGAGYVVDCGTARDPYAGEETMYRGFHYAGTCNAVGATLPPVGTGSIWFDLNEAIAAWSDGGTMDNSIKSAKSRAPDNLGTQTAWMREYSGGGFGHYRYTPAGTTTLFPTFKYSTQCPPGSNCLTAPTLATSFFIKAYYETDPN